MKKIKAPQGLNAKERRLMIPIVKRSKDSKEKSGAKK